MDDQLDEARIYLEELLRQDPENPDLFYNQGPCDVDLGQLDLEQDLLRHSPTTRARARTRLHGQGARPHASARPPAGYGVCRAGPNA
jgi:hypothetical protein